MKIVHLCLSAFFVDNYSYQENILPKYHVKMGYDVTVIASLFTFNNKGEGCYLDGYTEYEDKNGFHVVRLPYKSPICINKFLKSFDRFAEILEREAPDIIFSHNVSYSDISILVRYIKRHPYVKVYADNHADYINSANNKLSKYILHPIIWRYYAELVEPYLIKCYGVTPMRCRFLQEMYHLSPEKIDFLPMGVDDDSIPNNKADVKESIRKELSIPRSDIVVITGGKIDRLKNTHLLLDALNRINNKNIHLIICGTLTPEMVFLKQEIDNNPNVHYLGWCNAERVMNCMVASDIACFPGTHSTLWEQSVGIGLPSIFKRWSEMDHVNINNNCIFVKGDDVDEVAGAICFMIDNYEEYRKAANIASSHFLYSNIAKKSIGL